jgi:hypothetical protein
MLQKKFSPRIFLRDLVAGYGMPQGKTIQSAGSARMEYVVRIIEQITKP